MFMEWLSWARIAYGVEKLNLPSKSEGLVIYMYNTSSGTNCLLYKCGVVGKL